MSISTPLPSHKLPHSLEDIHSSVPIPKTTWWRHFLAFSGPAFLVSVGYMDPGNWGTDLEAGSSFGYRLMWVLLMSNLMAVLLQGLSTRLGVVTGHDLAQACRENYPRRTAFALWILCEIAIAACDLAEVIGTVIALKLLFGIPYLWGLLIAACDTFALLALQKRGIRLLEVVTLALIAVIGVSFLVEILLAKPVWTEVVQGLVPGFAPGRRGESLYVAIGILGATVMPHNLYLHSALVQTRSFPQTIQGKRLACKWNLIDSVLALNGAFFINAAILILAAAKFQGKEVESLQDAHQLLPEALGTTMASVLFAVALLASGQSSTLTGTLAGQVVMEGFVHLHIRPWLRRLFTRAIAIFPALIVIGIAGSDRLSEDKNLLELLVLSQVILSFQLPFAIVPLVHFTNNRSQMGEFVNRPWLKACAWSCAAIVVGLNVVLLYLQTGRWAESAEKLGWNGFWVLGPTAVIGLAILGFLVWITLYPWIRPHVEETAVPPPPVLPAVRYHRIGVAVEFAGNDAAVLSQAAELARAHGAALIPIHVVEGFGASFHGEATIAHESRDDRLRMADLNEHLRARDLDAQGVLGFGDPSLELVRIAQEQHLDLLVLGTHGHRFLADIALGQTVAPLLHKLTIPVLVVPNRPPQA